ncbi:hypothetical protein DTO032I3_8378 [Paecilomyces variotii]|nr:hypothetical protein DTO032I3_8378 [Paecilomyces variotii]
MELRRRLEELKKCLCRLRCVMFEATWAVAKQSYGLARCPHRTLAICLSEVRSGELDLADCTWRTAPGGLHLADCTWRTAPGGLHLADCTWRTAPGGLHLADCTWRTAPGGLHLADCTWRTAPGGLHLADCTWRTAPGGLHLADCTWRTAPGGMYLADLEIQTWRSPERLTESQPTSTRITPICHVILCSPSPPGQHEDDDLYFIGDLEVASLKLTDPSQGSSVSS